METRSKTKKQQKSSLSSQPGEVWPMDRLVIEIDILLSRLFNDCDTFATFQGFFLFCMFCFSAILGTLNYYEITWVFGYFEFVFKTEEGRMLYEASWKHFLFFLTMCVHMALFAKVSLMYNRDLSKEMNTENVPDKFLGDVKRRAFNFKLDSVIRRYAWRKLLEHSSPLERYCLEIDRKDFTCIVDWTALTFKHEVTKFSPKVKDGTVIKTSRGDLQTGQKWVTLWSSCYDNASKMKQSHIFRGSRGTTTWVDVDLERCYTVNKEVHVHFNLHQIPHYFSAESTVSLNKVKGEMFHEVHTWEINSEIEVKPSSRAHAQLLARQECSVVEFEIRTTLSIPKGAVPVIFKHKTRNVSFALNVEDVDKAFQLVEDGGVLKPEEKRCVELIEKKWLDKDGVGHMTYHPQIITRGTCICLRWTDQRVDIKTSPLSMDESTSDGDHNMNKTPLCHTEEDPSVDSFVFVDQPDMV
ncbi:uncharacterized protein LOC131952919 [Physella acuta]|uniref:uncharacterized protein LOC131952919 n=1 Tax=Physella acuta TaxID=109671 RepID=UPI0027DE74E0|nr:uncharacterized protein LOC131952919 [Physella acuta]